MNRFIGILLTIVITALIAGGGTYFYMNNTDADLSDTVDVHDESATTEEPVGHHSDDYISFDYPGDLRILVRHFGEGSHGETISFLKEEDDETFTKVGPDITITNEGDWSGEPEYVYGLFEKSKDENSEEIMLGSLEAYVDSLHEDFGGEDYKEVRFFTDRETSEGETLYYRGYIVPENVFVLGDTYDEILEMFIATATH